MAEGDSPTCPLCGGNNFVDVEVFGNWECHSSAYGGPGSAPVSVLVTDISGTTSGSAIIRDYSDACSTCGFVILRVDTNQLKSAEEKRDEAGKARKRRSAKKAAKKKAAKEKAEAEAEVEKKKKKEIKKLKQKIKKLEDS